jgi:cyclic beta-1,2-glucan synthetase
VRRADGGQPRRASARDRGHQLRRDRARLAGRRPRAPRVRQAVRRDRVPARAHAPCCAAVARARPTKPTLWAVHVLSARARRARPVEWETDRSGFSAAGAAPDDPQALDGRAAVRHHGRGARPHRQPAPARAPGARRRWCGSPSRRASPPAVRRPSRWRSVRRPRRRRAHLRAGLCPRAERAAPPGRDRPRRRSLFERLASRVLYGRRLAARRPRRVWRANTLGPGRLWGHGISGDLPILLVRVVRGRTWRWCGRCCRRRSTGGSRGSRRRRHLNEHPVSYLDEMQAQLETLLDERALAHLAPQVPAAPSCCAATACPRSACCWRRWHGRC